MNVKSKSTAAHTTLITGGNSGIGAAIGAQLLGAGQRVVSLGLALPESEHDNLIAYTCDPVSYTHLTLPTTPYV